MNARTFKYVIRNDLYPRLCSEAETHKDICPFGATSAGFASLSADPQTGKLSVSCWGKSKSLGLESKREDADLILCMFEAPNLW
jgi:hypothetical protein